MYAEAAPHRNWRYVALGVEPLADTEAIERAYQDLRESYAARVENYSDFDSRRSLRLLEEAYQSLRHEASGPQIHVRRQAPARKLGNLQSGFLICFAVLAAVSVAVLLYGFRPYMFDLIRMVPSQADALVHYLAVAT